jgi:hypothetical protein
MKHTDGPWKVFPQYTDRSVYPIGHKRADGAYDILAEVNSQGGTEETASANARLIALAPELLEALHTFLVGTDGLMDLYDDSRSEAYAEDLKVASAARDLARELIKRAEGSAQ